MKFNIEIEGKNSGFHKGSSAWVLEQIKNMKFEFVNLKSGTAIQAIHDNRKFLISAIISENSIHDDIHRTMEKETKRQFVAYVSSDYGFYESVYIFNCHLTETAEKIVTDFREKIARHHENLVDNDFNPPVKIEISFQIK